MQGSADMTAERTRLLLRSFAHRIDQGDAGAHNNLGVLYYNTGLYDEAAAEFIRALELDPRMEVAQRNFEVACVRAGRADARVAELRAHLQRQPTDREARWELGRTCALLGDHAGAIAEFATLLAANPADIGSAIQLGLSQKATDAIDAARASFGRALELDPHSSLVHFYLAEIEYNRGLNDRAIELLRRAIDLNARNHEAWYLLGFVLGDEGRHEEARDAANTALSLNPELSRAQPNLALADAATARYVDKARRDTGRRVELTSATGTASASLTHFTLGLAFQKRGYYAEALAEYGQALQRGENNDLVTQAIAQLHLLRREPALALPQYVDLLNRSPENARLWNEHGVALHQTGQYVDALESYSHAATLSPRYAVALNNRGVAQYHAGDVDAAAVSFALALEADPSLAKARLNQALLLYKGRRFQQSLETYRAVLETSDANAVAWNGAGLVLTELRRFDEARAAFARALDARPRYAEAHYNLSFTLSSLGDFEGALRETKLALEIDPYYVPQRFELALDFAFDDAELTIEPDLGGERRVETAVEEFSFDPGVLDSFFTDLAPSVTIHDPRPTTGDPFALAQDYLSKGFIERAQAEVTRAMSLGADHVRGGTLLGDIFASQRLWGEALERYREVRRESAEHTGAMRGEATALLQLGRAAEARTLAEVLAVRAPNDVEALLLAADARDATGDAPGALDALRHAARLAPRHAQIPKQIGDVAFDARDFAAAEQAYRDALALDAAFVSARHHLARTLVALNRPHDAETELDLVLRAAPDLAVAVIDLARLRRDDQRGTDAVDLLADLLTRDPYQFDALIALGETLLALGRLADAMIAFQRVLRFHPSHAEALLNEGIVLGMQSRYRDAMDRWHRVIALDADSAFALRARGELHALLEKQRALSTNAAA